MGEAFSRNYRKEVHCQEHSTVRKNWEVFRSFNLHLSPSWCSQRNEQKKKDRPESARQGTLDQRRLGQRKLQIFGADPQQRCARDPAGDISPLVYFLLWDILGQALLRGWKVGWNKLGDGRHCTQTEGLGIENWWSEACTIKNDWFD